MIHLYKPCLQSKQINLLVSKSVIVTPKVQTAIVVIFNAACIGRLLFMYSRSSFGVYVAEFIKERWSVHWPGQRKDHSIQLSRKGCIRLFDPFSDTDRERTSLSNWAEKGVSDCFINFYRLHQFSSRLFFLSGFKSSLCLAAFSPGRYLSVRKVSQNSQSVRRELYTTKGKLRECRLWL